MKGLTNGKEILKRLNLLVSLFLEKPGGRNENSVAGKIHKLSDIGGVST